MTSKIKNKLSKIKSKTSRFIASILLHLVMLICIALYSKLYAAEVFIKEGKGYPICQEIKQIIEEPENKKLLSYPYFRKSSEFVIPKKYKNFSLPVWHDLESKDLEKFVKSAQTKIDAINEFNKKFEGKAKVLIQKADIDIDNDGKNDVVLRFRSSDEKSLIPNTLISYALGIGTEWFQYVGDINPTIVSEEYNRSYSGDPYFTFFYGKKTFFIKSSSSTDLLLYKPQIIQGIKEYGRLAICIINLKLTKEEDNNLRKKNREQLEKWKKEKALQKNGADSKKPETKTTN